MVVRSVEDEGPALPRFYAGRDVFITGASGFMGKVLVERLLSTCPEVGRLHLLMRDKRGQPPHKRLAQLKQSQVFDKVRARDPRQLDKIQCVAGDVSLPLLGLSAADVDQLREVSVMFHGAATVKFCEPLGAAVASNVASTLHLMDLADKLPALQVLVHMSTAFTNVDVRHIEERVYSAPATHAQVLTLLDTLPPDLIQQITAQYISPKPNTYVFSKSLAEVAVHEREPRHYAAAIFRPSIVVSSHRAPFPGWVEGLSGACGAIAGMASGALRVFNIDMSARAELVPVDIAIDNMLAVAWETATDKSKEVRVYYCGSQENSQTWAQFRERVFRGAAEFPFDNVLYYPSTLGIKNKYVFKILEVLLQTVPLHIAGYLFKIIGVQTKVSLSVVSQRLRAMSRVMAFFACREWSFDTSNMRALRDRLKQTDGHIYHLDINDVNWEQHTRDFVLGVRRHVQHYEDDSVLRARKHLDRLRVVHHVVLLLLALVVYKLFALLLPLTYS